MREVLLNQVVEDGHDMVLKFDIHKSSLTAA